MSDIPVQSIALIIPTLNASKEWPELQHGIMSQTVPLDDVLIIDSSSNDGTAELAEAAGFKVLRINRADFNHGRTRQMGAERMDANILVYMTQDAQLLNPDSIEKLVRPFVDPSVGAAYGRQIPRIDAGPIEYHARTFNYPNKSVVRTMEDSRTLGIRATFLSNSFSAYRRSALLAVGGFPANTIMAEDALVAGRLLLSNWKTAYVAEAQVLHSHPYGIFEEFKRYFDTGVYHTKEPWLLEKFGSASSEGKRFVFSELKMLWPEHFYLIPSAFLRTIAKFLGYQLGRREATIPTSLKRRLSLHKGFWDHVA